MRNALCKSLYEYSINANFTFITGDVGYKVLEPLRDSMGPRFINVGVAEQNMVSIAAGLAITGFDTWIYSIAPFLYNRALEQIRIDLCLHCLPVKIIGNGGGYAYGVMGPTHHAIEDYGILMNLLNMKVFIPTFSTDIPEILSKIKTIKTPTYIRLGLCEKPADFTAPFYSSWRKLTQGNGPALLVIGPIAGGLIKCFRELPNYKRPNLWVLTELPIDFVGIPNQFIADIKQSKNLFIIEEHVAHGSVGQTIAHELLLNNNDLKFKFTHHCAQGYPSGFYGSQDFHRKECGLDVKAIMKTALGLL